MASPDKLLRMRITKKLFSVYLRTCFCFIFLQTCRTAVCPSHILYSLPYPARVDQMLARGVGHHPELYSGANIVGR